MLRGLGASSVSGGRNGKADISIKSGAESGTGGTDREHGRATSWPGKDFEKRAVPISIVCAGIYFCYSGILSFLTPYAEQTHLQTAASFFFIVYSAVILLTRPFTGRFFDRKGERFIMLPAFVSFFIGMLLLSRTHGSILLLVSAAFVGFGIGAIQSCGLALAVKNSPEERVGYVNSTFYIFVDLATGLGPFLLGFLIPAAGYRGLYLILAGVTVLFGILYLAVSGKSRKRTERE